MSNNYSIYTEAGVLHGSAPGSVGSPSARRVESSAPVGKINGRSTEQSLVGSIKGQKYPDISAREAVEIVDSLVTTFDGAPSDRDAFAREIGHESAASGAFKTKIADVRRYGLLPSRGLEPTELAESVVAPQDDESERAALFRAYRNVPILDRLYGRLGGQSIDGDVSDVLADLTGSSPDEAAAAAADLEPLYARMRRYAPDDAERERPAEERAEAAATPGDGVVVRVGDDRLVLAEVSDANLELARLFVEAKQGERAEDADDAESEGRDADASGDDATA